jgi:hypothetical protein
MTILIRLFVITFAFLLASIAAGAVLSLEFLGLYGPPPPSGFFFAAAWSLTLRTSRWIMVMTIAPTVLLTIISERRGLRLLTYYLVASIGMAFALYVGGILLDFLRGNLEFGAQPKLWLVIAAALSAGLTFWIVAGRNAGKLND